jgi:hypothetical protein
VAFAGVAKPLLASIGANAINRGTELSTPNSTIVVRPNVDTLYGPAIFDLYQDNVNVTVPEIGVDRYWSFSFFDPYGYLPHWLLFDFAMLTVL